MICGFGDLVRNPSHRGEKSVNEQAKIVSVHELNVLIMVIHESFQTTFYGRFFRFRFKQKKLIKNQRNGKLF